MHDQNDQPLESARPVNRRDFLGTGAGALAVASALGNGRDAAAQAASKNTQSAALPKRTLGRTGVEVTILNLGTWRSVGLDRILRFAWSNGVRYVDTAKSYGSEPAIGRWLQAMPEIRKELFLVTKDTPSTPRQLINQLDQRLAALKTDYVDLIFIHALGDHHFDQVVDWPKSKEFKETAEAIRKSGKARFVGFSTHFTLRAQLLQAAADGGFVDVIMLQNNPWIAQEIHQEDEINRALDACHKRGIGLISMKQVAGNTNLNEIGRLLPGLKEKGLSPYQGLLHAIWTDERFSSCCVSMRNTDQVRENTLAARSFKPLTTNELKQLRDACIAAGPTLCASCDGRCSQAGGTLAELGNLTRFLTYHDHHGYRTEARRLYGQLSDAARDWTGADLEAAREACPNKLDFAKLLRRADEVLG
ncbi:MAG TPA: aldo/keto reductase [Isosphaeraceae bacterium]|nr:aldo/keto reductase [Isosphaeraceae bacterium]